MSGKVVIPTGSQAGMSHVDAIGKALSQFGIQHRVHIASAHKTPRRLLDLLDALECVAEPVVLITVAGRSNALSGMVDAVTTWPVIPCPPPSEAWGAQDICSSLRMPSGAAPMVVEDPGHAAQEAAKMLGLQATTLREAARLSQEQQVQRLLDQDAALAEKRGRSLAEGSSL
ncbi:MAG: AIR carboxylase family protein [Spirochaetales bacterium]|nr:AIR carboxylase family protein [Spirochaetales bacterium]